MNCNPFSKDESINCPFISDDFREVTTRFNYLKEPLGIGVFLGTSGLGKTYIIRDFTNNLNKDLYKVIYINASHNMLVFDFIKLICNSLNLDTGACYKIDLYQNIQNEIIRLVKHDKVKPIVIIDDAHNLSREIIFNLKILYDFEIDSKDYVTLILIGYLELKTELSKNIQETLNQRIIVNYKLNGLSRKEVKNYIKTRMEYANLNNDIFSPDALSALYSCSKSSPRRLNTLVTNCLMLTSQNKKNIIDSDIVINAKNEMNLD